MIPGTPHHLLLKNILTTFLQKNILFQKNTGRTFFKHCFKQHARGSRLIRSSSKEDTTKRAVPACIQYPSYAETGHEARTDEIEILDPDGLASIKESCVLARKILDLVSKHVQVGASTNELDQIAHEACIDAGAYPSPLGYHGYPKSICTSVNNVACHGIPDNRKLASGDIVSIDVSVFYNGFHGDCAATYPVGNVDENRHKLLVVAAHCLMDAINVCRHAQSFHVIGKTISQLAKKNGFSVIPAFCGHGIGTKFHCPPSILHYDNQEEGQMLKGMIFTIEPVICEGDPEVVVLEDGWTAITEDNGWSAQFEHTILITENGAEILTKSSEK